VTPKEVLSTDSGYVTSEEKDLGELRPFDGQKRAFAKARVKRKLKARGPTYADLMRNVLASVGLLVFLCGAELGIECSAPGDQFIQQALSLPPALSWTHVHSSRFWNTQSGRLTHAIATANIAAGYTETEISRWMLDVMWDEDRRAQMETRFPTELAEARGAVRSAASFMDALDSLHETFDPRDEDSLDRQEDYWPNLTFLTEDDFAWFITKVESPYRYILGNKYGLGLDVVLFLNQLQQTGRFVSKDGRVLASLPDAGGRPFSNLVAEYAIHELLEQTIMLHDQIIELTTELFGRGAYLWPGRRPTAERVRSGTQVFMRPGQTPLGRALRIFIEKRLELYIPTLLSRLVRASFFDDRDRRVRVLSLQGTVKDITLGSSPRIVIAHKASEWHIDFARLVRLEPVASLTAATFDDSVTLSETLIMSSIQIGFPVTLSALQVRSLAGSPSKISTTILQWVLAAIVYLRDAEGARIRSSTRLDRKEVVSVLRFFTQILAVLRENNLQVVIEDLILNDDPREDKPPSFSYPMMTRGKLDSNDWYRPLHEQVDHIVSRLISFTHLVVAPFGWAGPNWRLHLPPGTDTQDPLLGSA
jgi:hypothetical protein